MFGETAKETNFAHAPHHPEKFLKFSQIHSKRGNMRNVGRSAGIVNINLMFPKGRHTMNAKMMSRSFYLIFMTDTGSIQREIRRRITNKTKMASQKCGDELQNLQGAEDSFAFLALFFLI